MAKAGRPRSLTPEQEAAIRQAFQDRQPRKRQRLALAEQLGISYNALVSRAHRLRYAAV